MTYIFSQRSERALSNVHPDLVRVVYRALSLSPVDFIVTEGRRTRARQQELLESGASRTMNSRHLSGHAVDLAPMENKRIPWEDWSAFAAVAGAMKQAAAELRIPLVWGGDWTTFRDGPHFELPREVYP